MFSSPVNLTLVCQPHAVAGGWFAGTVYADIRSECNATMLKLEINGEEYAHTHWTTRHSSGTGKNRRTHTRSHNAYASRSLLHVEVPLTTFANGRAPPGRLAFPFQAQLPANLPESFTASGGGGDCAVRYGASARLWRPGMFERDGRASARFSVVALPLPEAVLPVHLPPCTSSVDVCCCFNRGSMTLSASLSDTQVSRGELLACQIAVLNQSSSELESVQVSVTQHVRWHAGGHTNHARRVLIAAPVAPQSLPGTVNLDKDLLKAMKEARKTNPQAMQIQTFNQVLAMLGQTRPLTLQLPNDPDVKYSYAGRIINVKHDMALEATTGCCITNPRIGTPLRIAPQARAAPAVLLASAPPSQAMALGQQPMPMSQPAPQGFEQASVQTAIEVDMQQAKHGGGVCEAPVTEGAGELPESAPPPQFSDASAPQLPTSAGQPASVQGLLAEMEDTFDDNALLERKLDDKEWAALLAALTPAEYAACVSKVSLAFDQTRVATLLAGALAAFTSAHLATAIQSADTLSRENMLKTLAPKVVDLQANGGVVLSVLSDWERLVAKDVLPQAA